MTREDVINNLMESYGERGVSRKRIEDEITDAENKGFSYQNIHVGLRMALGSVTGKEELFTMSEMAEALGFAGDEFIQIGQNIISPDGLES